MHHADSSHRPVMSALAGVALVTWIGRSLPVNATTVGFAYLLLVLVIATVWGFPEVCGASVAATLGVVRCERRRAGRRGVEELWDDSFSLRTSSRVWDGWACCACRVCKRSRLRIAASRCPNSCRN